MFQKGIIKQAGKVELNVCHGLLYYRTVMYIAGRQTYCN